jgi:hypothetical protein
MKRAKVLFAILLCGTLLVGLVTPAFADTSAAEFTVSADKKMVATGENITLTAINAPQVQAGQILEYRWYFSYRNDRITNLLGTTEDPVLQTKLPAMGADYWSTPYNQKHPLKFWCVAEISDDNGLFSAYTSGKVDVMGYYSLGDSFAVTYASFALALTFIPMPTIVFETPTILIDAFVYFFGFLWLPFVALANSVEAGRVNG